MSRIEKLIAELCPDGVEFRELGEIGRRNAGTSVTASKMKAIAVEGGPIRIFAGGQNIADVAEDAVPKKDVIRQPSIIVKSRGYIGFTYYDKPFTHKSELWSYTITSREINQKFVYYYLLTKQKELQEIARATSVKIPQLSVRDTDSLRIPIPPLEVQREIVKVLDTFTQLEAELEAELEARRRQYHHYRDALLNLSSGRTGFAKIDALLERLCPDGVEYKTIGDFGELVRGNGMPKSDFVESGVGCIHYGQIYTYYGIWTTETKSFVSEEKAERLAKVDPGDLVITNTSENIEDVCKAVAWLGKTQIVTGGHATVLKHDQDPKYLSYYLQTPHFFAEKKKHVTGTKVIDVSARSLAKIKIPIPPLEVQREIVAILDRFDALVNDLTSGLPAEIEARRKQYHHYRDRLLTFQEKTHA